MPTLQIAADTLQASHDGEVSTGSTSYVLFKTITITEGSLSGVQRFYLELKKLGGTANAIVKKNGVQIGSMQSTGNTSYTGFTQDLSVVAAVGDTFELWLKQATSGTVYARNFRVSFDTLLNVPFASSNS